MSNAPYIIIDDQQQIELPHESFLVIVYDKDVKIDAPGHVLISLETCLKEIKIISQSDWETVSTSDLFKIIWYEFFQGQAHATDIPETVDKIRARSEEQQYIAGLIILTCESFFQEHNPFIVTPEGLLGTATEERLISGINVLRAILGGSEHALDSDVDYALSLEASEGKSLSAHELIELKQKAISNLKQRIEQNLKAFSK